MLGQDSARAFYGPGHVRAAHELGAIQTLLITDSLFRVNDVARVSAAPRFCPAVWYSSAGRALTLTVQKRGWSVCCIQPDSTCESVQQQAGWEVAVTQVCSAELSGCRLGPRACMFGCSASCQWSCLYPWQGSF